MHINHLAVIIAAISDFAIGALWYSPVLFYGAWMNANGFTVESIKGGNPIKTYGLTLLFSLIISYNLAFFLGDTTTTAAWGAQAGALAGLWAVLGLWIIALFEKRNARYMMINGGYLLVAFTLKGYIIGVWR